MYMYMYMYINVYVHVHVHVQCTSIAISNTYSLLSLEYFLAAVEIIGQTLTTDVWTSYDDPMSELFFEHSPIKFCKLSRHCCM